MQGFSKCQASSMTKIPFMEDTEHSVTLAFILTPRLHLMSFGPPMMHIPFTHHLISVRTVQVSGFSETGGFRNCLL